MKQGKYHHTKKFNAKTSLQTGYFRYVSDKYDKAGTSDGVKKELDEKLLARNITTVRNGSPAQKS